MIGYPPQQPQQQAPPQQPPPQQTMFQRLQQTALSQGEKMRLSQLQGAKSHVAEKLSDGTLHEDEARNLFDQIDKQLSPLQAREAHAEQLQQQQAKHQMMDQAAQQFSIEDMHRKMMAQNAASYVGHIPADEE